ncbi:MFS transporter [Novosphingobium sp. 9]|uniref:MFS transporter n=1 Tax=Novosphingobium sp. 9 TaxID=2025349 RepID=UPI0021B6BD17|nr:MFS transporter [Novosphingobium sp. 9]
MKSDVRPSRPGSSYIRYWILVMLFLVTSINYADRASMSIAGSAIKQALGISSVELGFIFSGFAWSYVIAQIPGGAFLDRFGSRRVYIWSIIAWSSCTFASGFCSYLAPGSAVIGLFILRLALGGAEAPSFPANARLVAAWFPDRERGTASAIFNAAQYGALVIFSPLMGWIVQTYSWHYVFFVMGSLGLCSAVVFSMVVHAPLRHPWVSDAELDLVREGGGQVELDATKAPKATTFSWKVVRELLSNRMLLGIYLGQYCVNALTFFFTTWFPVYLVHRGLSITEAGFGAAIPAVAGFAGGVIGGVMSDALVKRGHSLTFSRKLPVFLGMSMAAGIVCCNLINSMTLVIAFMALAFFGKALGAMGWAVIADAAPRTIAGLSGAMFNMVGNFAGIVTPIVIGYIVNTTGSFSLALAFLAAHGVVCVLSYAFIVGPIQRFSLASAPADPVKEADAPLIESIAH